MPRRQSWRSQPYRAARDRGNVEAGSQAPASRARRKVLRTAYRRTKSALENLVRMLGLVGKGRR
jgi:hypothetical protein